MQKMKVGEVSNLLGVSQTCVYRKAKALGKKLSGLSFKEKGVLFFTPEAVELIRQTISTAPAETTLQASPVTQAPADLAPLGEMQRGILALAESFRSEMAGLREDNRKLREEVTALRSLLTAPAIPQEAPKPVKVWEPVRLQPAPLPWYQRIWAELFEPDRLRALEG